MTATDLVVTTLRGLALPVEAQATLLTIFKGEVGDYGPGLTPVSDPWTVQVGYTYWSGALDLFPNWPGIPVGGGLVSTAFGAFQITHTTWLTWKTITGAPQDMEPASQCILAWLGANRDYGLRTNRNLLADLKAGLAGNVQIGLIATWPGGMAKFSTRYAVYLAAMQAPAPTTPAPQPENATITIGGSTWTGTLTRTAGAVLLGAGLGVGGMATQMPFPPPPPIVQAQQPLVQQPLPLAQYGIGDARLSEFKACYNAAQQRLLH